MKVLNVCSNDYANFAFNNAKALRSVGVDCEAVSLTPHIFRYTECARVVNGAEMRRLAEQADIVQVFHTQAECLPFIPEGKRMTVYHTGTIYRQKPEKYNALFNPIVERVFIDSPEFFTLGGKNVTYVATAIDTDKIKRVQCFNDRTVFAHYPSLPETKGTETIIRVMAEFPEADFRYSTERVSHDENLKRMASCDVYIELMAQEQFGRPYGSFGVTAFEAAAMGKMVITNSAYHSVYEQAYGTSGWLCVANSVEALRGYIRRSIGCHPEDTRSRGAYTRAWIEAFHSYEATGKYLKKFLDL
jgi:hypothetical protein